MVEKVERVFVFRCSVGELSRERMEEMKRNEMSEASLLSLLGLLVSPSFLFLSCLPYSLEVVEEEEGEKRVGERELLE